MSKKKFWILSLTWGIPMTIVGFVVALFLLFTGHKPEWFGYMLHFTVKSENGWGLSLGPVIVTTSDCADDIDLLSHECGHSSYQMFWFGWLFPFIVAIPSAIRFWHRYYLMKNGTKSWELPPYNSVWFERTATEYGIKFVEIMRANIE